MDSKEKELSPEEKLYIAIENLYEEDKFELENVDGIEKTKVKADFVIDEANRIF